MGERSETSQVVHRLWTTYLLFCQNHHVYDDQPRADTPELQRKQTIGELILHLTSRVEADRPLLTSHLLLEIIYL